jgi:ribose transport system substrate-binding protein
LKDPGYRFIEPGCLDPPKVDAAKLAGEALQKTEKIDAVFAIDDASAFAAYQTFKAAGREKGVAFVGVGGLPSEGADYVRKHVLRATISHPTGGTEAIDAAVKILAGQKVSKKIVLPASSFAEEDIPALQSGRSK